MKYIGIDVSKRFHYAALSTGGKPFVFSNSGEGFTALLKWAREQGELLTFGLEPTGHYSNLITDFLYENGYTVRIIPGIITNRAKHLLSNSRNKTDAYDSHIIALCTEQGYGNVFEPRSEHAQTLRELFSYRSWAIKRRKSFINRLHRALDIVFPEFTQDHRTIVRSNWLPELLLFAPAPRHIVAMGESQFNRSFPSASKIPVLKLARASMGKPNWTQEDEIQRVCESLIIMNRNIAEYDKMIESELLRVPYANNLLTIPHMGITAVGQTLASAGDLLNYNSNRQLLSAAGLNLIEKSSGDKQGNAHISKEGSKKLRTVLYYCAVGMARQNSAFYEWYLSRKNSGAPTKKIFISGARKLLRIAHAVAHTNKPFRAVAV